jgi:hypothetical protein
LPDDATRDHNPVVYVMVRGRVYDDLNNLAFVVKDAFGYEPEVYALRGHDYPYRIVIPRAHWALVVGNLASGIDYPNFKSAVTKKQGTDRHDLYMRVWSTMNGAELELERMRERRKKRPPPGPQGALDWASPGRPRDRYAEPDPRSDDDMAALYDGVEPGSSAWYDMLAHAEDAAVTLDPPKPKPKRRRQKPAKKRGKKANGKRS